MKMIERINRILNGAPPESIAKPSFDRMKEAIEITFWNRVSRTGNRPRAMLNLFDWDSLRCICADERTSREDVITAAQGLIAAAESLVEEYA